MVRNEFGSLEAAVSHPHTEMYPETDSRWRVTEVSSIVLLLLDSRCPPLHCPPSLRSYIQNLKPRKEVILVLTKSDLVDPEALRGWRTWLKTWWGDEDVQIVAVQSYDVEMLQAGKSFLLMTRQGLTNKIEVDIDPISRKSPYWSSSKRYRPPIADYRHLQPVYAMIRRNRQIGNRPCDVTLTGRCSSQRGHSE
jgi:ribosome biogenesis GTPase A